MVVRRARQPLKPATWKPLHFSAPVGGINTILPASEIPDLQCPVLWNMIGAADGLRARSGSVEWVTGLTGVGGDNTVRSVLPYTGSKQNGSEDRLFCATMKGIWDVTNSTAAPAGPALVFGSQALDAGYGTWWVTTTIADRYLIFCDEENGYHIYTESTHTWTKVLTGAGAGRINAPGDASQYVAGTFFKNRNWFVRKDSTLADVLPISSVYGSPSVVGPAIGTQFDFGNKFTRGGILTGLYNWSYDGGQGMQNLLVAVSSGGDVVIYDGLDPTDATSFYLRGVWQTAGVPYGRRIATDFGGDVLILSSTGIFPLSKLVIGNPVIDRSVYSTKDISNLFSLLVDQYGGLKAWSLRFHPNDAALIVTVPTADGQATNQLVMSLATRGWSKYRGMPMVSGEAWRRKFYFGTHDGRVLISTGYVDGVLLSDPTGKTFTPVDYSLVTRTDKGLAQRIVRQVRPTILSGQNPSVNAEARFNYSQDEAAPPSILSTAGAPAALFDVAKFDEDVWAGDFIASKPVFGAAGRSPEVAVAIRGSAFTRTVLADIDVMYEEGGFF